jgi:hypothetical protein
MERIETQLIRDHIAATHAAVEIQLYAKYENFDVCELVQDNFTLYGQMVAIDALKPTKIVFHYKRMVSKYYREML